MKKSFNIQERTSTPQVQTPWNQADAPQHPGSVDLITTKQNKTKQNKTKQTTFLHR